jgi:hypothetical protein
MKLLTRDQERRMRDNGAANAERAGKDGKTEDFQPVVKLFCPWNGATWLLAELDPEDPDIAFGLCDLGTRNAPPISCTACNPITPSRRPRDPPRSSHPSRQQTANKEHRHDRHQLPLDLRASALRRRSLGWQCLAGS